jgi:hypothetical protein
LLVPCSLLLLRAAAAALTAIIAVAACTTAATIATTAAAAAATAAIAFAAAAQCCGLTESITAAAKYMPYTYAAAATATAFAVLLQALLQVFSCLPFTAHSYTSAPVVAAFLLIQLQSL